MVLKFGKHKGEMFQNTPISYQNWLLKQSWFKLETQKASLHQQLNGWDGHSKKGEAIYDKIFQGEKAESDRMYCDCGDMKLPEEKYCGWGCIAEHGI